jgi:hypothetical protein
MVEAALEAMGIAARSVVGHHQDLPSHPTRLRHGSGAAHQGAPRQITGIRAG